LSELLQQLINGLSLGSIYALIALGYTMVYGVLRFINFAHSDVFMIGAFAGYYLGRYAPRESIVGGLLVLVGSMAICAALGIIIERLAYRPLRDHSKLNVLITAIGVSLLLENAGQFFFGAAPKSFPALFPSRSFNFMGGLVLSSNQITVFVVTAALLVCLRFIVLRTRIGTAMRAVSFNPLAASLVGINNDVVISFTFGLGSALAAAGGILYSLNYQAIDPLMGILPGLKAFVAAVLGGIGNIPGAALGGLLLGIVEVFVNGSRFSTYTDAIAFAVLILILLFRPAGLLGKFQVEKV
jgi:branched-chain amino acid transport system permease protein